MNWARAKTILIALLLAVNLILGGIWLYRGEQVRAREARALEELCDVLESNGLIAKPEHIPDTLALTYDIERSPEEQFDAEVFEQTVKGLPVWEQPSAVQIVSDPGYWLWDEALPINGNPSFSAGYCLLQWANDREADGVLEECELGFSATLISSDVMRLKPCWRFLISGVEYYVPAT